MRWLIAGYTHELRNEVFPDPIPLFWSIFFKAVEMLSFQEERVAIKQGESYDTSLGQSCKVA
jgi:hypothetical protein